MKKITLLILMLGLSNLLFAQQTFKYIDGHQLALKGSYFSGLNNYDRVDSANRVRLTPICPETGAKYCRFKY